MASVAARPSRRRWAPNRMGVHAVAMSWKAELDQMLSREDFPGLLRAARRETAKVIRFLTSRLYSADEDQKWRAVRALGQVAGRREILGDRKAAELLQRFFWSLNDESGAVPYGVPEAIGEILAVRPELQPQFLPILCSMVTEEETSQTGAIERGVIWALGRIGTQVVECSPAAVAAVAAAASSHADHVTRRVAAWALPRIGPLPAD